jgi:acetyl-CoA carboxylase carboxyl transferase subunit beta
VIGKSGLDLPLVFLIDSLGVRVMEGRTVFNEAFQLIPALKAFADHNLVISACLGRCFGIGALLYAMGHLRLSVGGLSRINLAGPEVMRLFFGEKFDFDEKTSPEELMTHNDLIHEIVSSKQELFDRIKKVLAFTRAMSQSHTPMSSSDERIKSLYDARLLAIVKNFGEADLEIFPDSRGKVLRIFLIQRRNQLFGLFANAPGRTDNLITVDVLKKFRAGLTFFHRLGIPIVSMIDTPGGDPRIEQNNKDIIGTFVATCSDLIEFPYGKMGIILGRCYGGAAALMIPKFFGSDMVVASTEARLGIMHDSILSQVLKQSPTHLQNWQIQRASELDDLSDVISAGIIDDRVSVEALPKSIDLFLEKRAVIEQISKDTKSYATNRG